MIEDRHTTLVTGGASGIGLPTVEAFAGHGPNGVALVASGRARRVAGAVLPVDGGYTAR